jgi:uncharacterized protein
MPRAPASVVSPPATAKLELLVLQPTPFCNIDCGYCYLPDRRSRRVMAERTIERLFEELFSSSMVGDELTIAWHAGEPLIAGIRYYERAFAIICRAEPRWCED